MLRRLLVLLSLVAAAAPACAAGHAADAKLDQELLARAHAPRGRSRVILRLEPGAAAESVVRAVRGVAGRQLSIVGGAVADVPDGALEALAANPAVRSVSLDRPVRGTLERTTAAIGATWVRQNLGVDGSGVTVAIVDSGVADWHDDLGPTRVVRFADFVNFEPSAYDDYGHGTHVAGIIAGDGFDSGGRQAGVAPGASLLVEKVLDANGEGYISNVIAAIDYAVANRDALHVRVINLSVAAGVYESYRTDPLTLAAKRAVDAGIVVVSAAGNLGRTAAGRARYGGVGAPGNAPWVITVGASNSMGTPDRADDRIAAFSSRGPAAVDFGAKPDLVAPGVGIESLADPQSTLFATKPAARVWGTVPKATQPYLALSGTSMASPVVSGTIALMLQANPALTPNLVKAILEYTAEYRAGYDALTQGAGFLNARGAVELASALARGQSLAASHRGDPAPWSAHIIWGNHRIGGGRLLASATAWSDDLTWGAPTTPSGSAVAWGSSIDGDNVVWDASSGSDADVRGASVDDTNVVWGTACGGQDCGADAASRRRGLVWGASAGGNTTTAAPVVNDAADRGWNGAPPAVRPRLSGGAA
jgi:serine protease AprX